MTVSMYRAEAIHTLYPAAVQTIGGEVALDVNGDEISIDNALVDAKCVELEAQAILRFCKAEAKKRIAATDWSVLPDVGLANAAEFETYRAALRELIKTPVADPVWPTEPEPVWS